MELISKIQTPSVNEPAFLNRHNYHSINVQFVFDAKAMHMLICHFFSSWCRGLLRLLLVALPGLFCLSFYLFLFISKFCISFHTMSLLGKQ